MMGPRLATIAHSLSGDFNIIFIASDFSYDQLIPLYLHPDITPKWSSDQVKLLHDGCDANRLEKIKLIAKNETALKFLRVCWGTKDGVYNCGKCEKCTRTLLGLRAAGVKDHAISFASPLNINKVRNLNLTKKIARFYASENLKAFKEKGDDPEIVDALQYAFKKVDKWKLFKKCMQKERRRRKNQLLCLFSKLTKQ